jgi:hypothetical protein
LILIHGNASHHCHIPGDIPVIVRQGRNGFRCAMR